MKLPLPQIIKYSVLFLIFASVLGIFVIPYYSHIKKIYQSLAIEALDLESRYNKGQGVTQAHEDYQNYKDELPDFQTLFIKEGEELSLVTKLEEIADKYRLSQDLSLGTEKLLLDDNIKKISFNFTLKGDFTHLLGYLTELADISTNLTIQNINIKQDALGQLETSLMGYTYWLSNN